MRNSRTDDQSQLDPAEALMREVGEQLRQARLERGEDLEDVAHNLRIKPAYLIGLEEGDLSVMPGRTYALGFLRSYADYLGFDGDDLIAQIKSAVEDLTDRTQLHIRTPLPESRLPKAPIVILSLALLGGIYAGWSYLNSSGDLGFETVAEVPDNLRRLALDAMPGDAASGQDEPAIAVPAPVEAEPSGSSPETVEDRASELVEAEPVRPPAPDPAPPVLLPQAAEPMEGTSPVPDTAPADVVAEPAASATPPVLPEVAEPEIAAADVDGEADTLTEVNSADSDDASLEPGAGPATATESPVVAATEPPGEPTGDPDLTVAARIEADRTAEVAAAAPDQVPADAAAGIGAEPGLSEAAETSDDAAAGTRAEQVVARLLGSQGTAENTPTVHEAQNTDARVIIRALEASWIQISSVSGDYLRSRTLQAGDIFLVPDRTDLRLWTGNAGGLEVIVDGETLPALGPRGTVVRDVSLEPAALRARVPESG